MLAGLPKPRQCVHAVPKKLVYSKHLVLVGSVCTEGYYRGAQPFFVGSRVGDLFSIFKRNISRTNMALLRPPRALCIHARSGFLVRTMTPTHTSAPMVETGDRSQPEFQLLDNSTKSKIDTFLFEELSQRSSIQRPKESISSI